MRDADVTAAEHLSSVVRIVSRGDGAISIRRALRLHFLVARGGTVPSALGVLLGVFLVASLPVGVASADPSASASTLDQQAQQLEAQLVSNGTALHNAAVELAAARVHEQAVGDAVASDRASLGQLDTKLNIAAVTLRNIAIDQYMRDTDTSAPLAVFEDSPMQAAATSTYEQLATVSTSNALDSYRVAAGAVQREETSLASQQALALADAQAVSRQYGVLEGAMASENAALARVRQEQLVLATGPPDGVLADALVGNGTLAEDLYRLRECESGDNYQDNTGNGYYGAYQFSPSTWEGLGYGGLPSDAPPPEQDQAAIRLEQSRGWGQWPACAAMLGLD